MANHLPEDQVRASVLAACRALIRDGAGLGTNNLRDRGAVGHDRTIRKIRDELVADGSVVRPAKETIAIAAVEALEPAARRPRADISGTPHYDASREVRGKQAAFSAYAAGLRQDIAAAERECVAAGELPAGGMAWWLAVAAQGKRRRSGGLLGATRP